MSANANVVAGTLTPLGTDEVNINFSTLTAIEIESRLDDLLQALTDSAVQSLTIEGSAMTEAQAKRIVTFLQQPEQALVVAEINLPAQLTNTRVQIELDNIVSNHRLIKNSQQFNKSQPNAEDSDNKTTKKTAKGRIRPKGKIKPKIEITLYEEIVGEETQEPEAISEELPVQQLAEPAQLETAPLPESILNDILAQPGYQDAKNTWEQINNRAEARQFRSDFIKSLQIDASNHPIHYLLRNEPDLAKWTAILSLGKEQYDALLDVYGHYGAAGIKRLFTIWNCGDDPFIQTAFKETHARLLKHMPSYLPFLTDTAFNETLAKIAISTQQSFWLALIKNHGKCRGYSDLTYLYKVFTEKTVVLSSMVAINNPINDIMHQKSLPETLQDMITLLKKCPEQDRDRQWEDIGKIDMTQQDDVHFIIDDMKLAEQHLELEDMAEFINTHPDCDPNIIKPAFYRYLARRKNHLPLEHYEKILDELFSYPQESNDAEVKTLANQVKIRMAFVLAKTTSSDNTEGFDRQEVAKEWAIFQDRTIQLEYMTRIKKNRSYAGALAFAAGVKAEGGDTEVRNKVLCPIINMAVTPPMSFLNKLLTLSEYKFLDPALYIKDMRTIQNAMLKEMDKAAELYAAYPQIMTKAIRLIKTETVQVNTHGKFIPPPEDVILLEQFVSTCNTLIAEQYNKQLPGYNPKEVILPLLTVFHLEYENNNALQLLVERYNNRLNAITIPAAKPLLIYALSLLQLVQDREHPVRLDSKILDTIQDDLTLLISREPPVTKKQIREWMHTNYQAHFAENALLDIKDEVDDSIFDSLGDAQQEIRTVIKTLVSNFDNDQETGFHKELATDLIHLTNSLTAEQSASLFEYCREAFKTNKLLSRDKQDSSPSYLDQFRALIQALDCMKSTAEFEYYMNFSKMESLKGSDDRNSLQKATYLLNTLYPSLLKQGIEPKNAINFAAKLVSNSPWKVLNKSHSQVNFSSTELLISDQEQLRALEEQIALFQFQQAENNAQHATRSPAELARLRQHIEAIIALAPDNSQFFAPCKNMLVLIRQIQLAIEERTTAYTNQHNAKSGFAKMGTWFKNLFSSSYTPSITEEEITRLEQAGITELIAQINEEMPTLRCEIRTRFQDVVLNLYNKKAELIEKYSNLTIRVNDFINTAVGLDPEHVSKNHNDTCQLISDLIELDDQNLVLSLMYHYAGGWNGGVKDLVELFNQEQYRALNSTLKKDFINVIITQMNNNVHCNKERVNEFLTYIYDNKDNQIITDCMHDYYQHAPYPPLARFMLWTKNLHDRESLDKAFAHYDKNPAGLIQGHDGREVENGFKLNQARAMVRKIPEIQKIITDTYLDKVELASKSVRDLSTSEILAFLKQYKEHPEQDHINLVVYATELLHRSKGQPPSFEKQGLGASFELNTTQIMAILSMLETGKKVTSEIATGEGKTRIMMILNACEFLKGNTVDFLTSNIKLAERDYLSALPFYKSLGAEISFITATSKIEDYKIGGINVSDPANLFLFRKKGISQNRKDEVLDPDKTKRALLLDEADVTFFDVSNTKYNFSSKTSQLEIDLLPVYPLLMEFFAQSETETTYMENKQRCNEQLLDYIETRNPRLFKTVKKLKIDQLEKLQDAAYIARRLEYNVDYSVVTEATTPTALGDKKVAAAMCLIGSRINENARFPERVHACLHAELNRLMKAPASETHNEYLREIIGKCQQKERNFTIEPQRQLAASTSSSIMLKDYNEGTLMAVTGTVGSDLEKREARIHFKTKFIHIPRHHGMHRYDRPIIICETLEKYLDTLVTSILDARAKGESTLILCKDDNDSRELHEALERRLQAKRDKDGLPKLTRIHAATDYEDTISEAAYIKNDAGKPGYVTISTDMEGRGTDFDPHKEHRVLHAHLPDSLRDYFQGVGRSARFGKAGTTQMILSVDMLKRDFGINSFNTDFYLNPEAAIRRMQIFASINKELRRLFQKSFDEVLEEYSTRYESVNSKETADAWSHFLEQYHLHQELIMQVIEAQLQDNHPNIELIEQKLAEHSEKAHELWEAFTEHLPEEQRTPDKKIMPTIKKPVLLEEWLTDMKRLQSEGKDTVEIEEARLVRVHTHYDPATIGSLSILKYSSAFSPNILGWLRGEGPLFPNLRDFRLRNITLSDLFSFGLKDNLDAFRRGEGVRFPNWKAWRSGNLSFRNMISQWPLFRFFISPREEVNLVKTKIPATYAMFYNKHPEIMEKVGEELDDNEPSNHQYNELWGSEEETVAPEVTSESGNKASIK